jgi:predicted metal-dependent HD superfamily phosphohydrolase
MRGKSTTAPFSATQPTIDFGLEVLGRSGEEYELYAGHIRQEYAHFSEIDYAKGRVGVLERFLAREKLYFSNALGAELGRGRIWVPNLRG